MPITIQDLIKQTLLGSGGSSGGGSSGGGSIDENDGATYMYITLTEGRMSPRVMIYLKGEAEIDRGDGSEPELLTGTSMSTPKGTSAHDYPAPGEYIIRISGNGTIGFFGGTGATALSNAVRHTSADDSRNAVYRNALQKVVLGQNVTRIDNYAFAGCDSLREVRCLCSINTVGANAFHQCFSLSKVILPAGLTSIGSNAFQYCESLVSVKVPGSVGNIAIRTFSDCGSMKYCDFTDHSSVPTLANTNAFTGIPDDCEIRVPAALYDEWIAATNWATYADYIKAY